MCCQRSRDPPAINACKLLFNALQGSANATANANQGCSSSSSSSISSLCCSNNLAVPLEARRNKKTHKISKIHAIGFGRATPRSLDFVDVALQLLARDILAVLLEQLFQLKAAHPGLHACERAYVSMSLCVRVPDAHGSPLQGPRF